jgi:hypothetical protein
LWVSDFITRLTGQNFDAVLIQWLLWSISELVLLNEQRWSTYAYAKNAEVQAKHARSQLCLVVNTTYMLAACDVLDQMEALGVLPKGSVGFMHKFKVDKGTYVYRIGVKADLLPDLLKAHLHEAMTADKSPQKHYGVFDFNKQQTMH